MKKTFIYVVLGIITFILICGCDKRQSYDIPTNPMQVDTDDASRVLAFETANQTIYKSNLYTISMYVTGNITEAMTDDVVTVTIGDSLVQLYYVSAPPFFRGWKSFENHRINDNEEISLAVNDNTIVNTHFKALNKVSVAFPAHYDYQQPLLLNWSVNYANQYQFVRAGSYDIYDEGTDNTASSYIKRISPTSASYTFPANCVSLAGDSLSTNFTIGVEEVNYKIVKKTAVMVYQYEFSSYTADKSIANEQQTMSRILELSHHLRRIR